MYKFDRLEVYQLALSYVDLMYALARVLPRAEERNLHPQLIRACNLHRSQYRRRVDQSK